MTTLNADASPAALAAGVAGGHRRDRVRAARPPVQAGPGLRRDDRGDRLGRGAATSTAPGRPLRDGYVSGGTRRNLDWVRPHLETALAEDELLLLADAQTSGGLLVVGEIPGAPVIGETTRARCTARWSPPDRKRGKR